MDTEYWSLSIIKESNKYSKFRSSKIAAYVEKYKNKYNNLSKRNQEVRNNFSLENKQGGVEVGLRNSAITLETWSHTTNKVKWNKSRRLSLKKFKSDSKFIPSSFWRTILTIIQKKLLWTTKSNQTFFAIGVRSLLRSSWEHVAFYIGFV